MGGVLGSFARVLFAVGLLTNMLWTTALMNLVYLFPTSQKTKEGWCLMLVQCGWRLALFFSPWVRILSHDSYAQEWDVILKKMAEFDAEDIKEGKTRRPLFILANHVCFFDTVLAVVLFPRQVMWRCRTYMADHLFKLPVLSTICKSVGHFPVHFSSAEDGVFKVDAKKMEEVEKRVDKHLATGGWLCFFPEGQMNKTPDTILPFRFGGMKKALAFDARIVHLVWRGNETVWPRKEQVGGFPGRVEYTLEVVAPNGCKAFVQEARKTASKEEAELEDHALLAKRLQEKMQKKYDSLPPSNALTNGKKKD